MIVFNNSYKLFYCDSLASFETVIELATNIINLVSPHDNNNININNNVAAVTERDSFFTLMTKKPENAVYVAPVYYHMLEHARVLATIDNIEQFEFMFMLAKMVCSRILNTVIRITTRSSGNIYNGIVIMQLCDGWATLPDYPLFPWADYYKLLMCKEAFDRFVTVYPEASAIAAIPVYTHPYVNNKNISLYCEYRKRLILIFCFCMRKKFNGLFSSDLVREIATFV